MFCTGSNSGPGSCTVSIAGGAAAVPVRFSALCPSPYRTQRSVSPGLITPSWGHWPVKSLNYLDIQRRTGGCNLLVTQNQSWFRSDKQSKVHSLTIRFRVWIRKVDGASYCGFLVTSAHWSQLPSSEEKFMGLFLTLHIMEASTSYQRISAFGPLITVSNKLTAGSS